MWSTKKVIRFFHLLAISKTDVPWVAYYNASSKSVNAASYTNGGWQKQVYRTGWQCDNTFCVSMALNDQGNSIRCLSQPEYLEISHIENDKWTSATVDPTPGSGMYCSLALYPNGSPAISYFDKSSRHLKYAYTNGAAWQFMDVDLRRDIGKYNSLAFGPDGAANISYFDEENDDLIYSRMVDSPMGYPELVDSFENVGTFTSLAFDPVETPQSPIIIFKGKYLRFAVKVGNLWTIQTVDSEIGTGKYTSLKYP